MNRLLSGLAALLLATPIQAGEYLGGYDYRVPHPQQDYFEDCIFCGPLPVHLDIGEKYGRIASTSERDSTTTFAKTYLQFVHQERPIIDVVKDMRELIPPAHQPIDLASDPYILGLRLEKTSFHTMPVQKILEPGKIYFIAEEDSSFVPFVPFGTDPWKVFWHLSK